ncbi:hypothetical protein LAG90_09810 [Marinilongibacter aquaticus]|uniref:hypothetical protein n=1 Tax=Marinilongibacter aquaticus TaxID=2975157 RepID=UPI0021BDD471|nr:hypothetical protein [Marinilongibacter aquaticus]UBM60928.1 hypothetical protein LAG90_09810 [Marinilongibacter aquaticus]
MKIGSIGILALALAFWACEEEQSSPQSLEVYYPLETGQKAEFEVQSWKYSVSEPETFRTYFLKEEIGEEVEGAFKLIRSTRASTEAAWRVDSIWTVYSEPDKLVRVENNVPIVKLVFPLLEGKSWDGNGLNSRDEEDFELSSSLDYPQNIQRDFPKAIGVVERLDSNLITMNRKLEWYAPYRGLVFKENTHLEYCQDENCLGSGQIVSGYRTIYRRID